MAWYYGVQYIGLLQDHISMLLLVRPDEWEGMQFPTSGKSTVCPNRCCSETASIDFSTSDIDQAMGIKKKKKKKRHKFLSFPL